MIDFRDYCEGCGGVLPDDNRATRRRYCSLKCWRTEYLRLEREALIASRANRPPCTVCGKPIPAEANGNRTTCSRACVRKAVRAARKGRNTHQCQHCGKDYGADRTGTKFCSPTCRDKARKSLPLCACKHCQKEFQPKKAGRVYCSMDCRNAAYRAGAMIPVWVRRADPA